MRTMAGSLLATVRGACIPYARACDDPPCVRLWPAADAMQWAPDGAWRCTEQPHKYSGNTGAGGYRGAMRSQSGRQARPSRSCGPTVELYDTTTTAKGTASRHYTAPQSRMSSAVWKRPKKRAQPCGRHDRCWGRLLGWRRRL